MSRVLVEKETIYTEEVNMLMKGATYEEVIADMERREGEHEANPFARAEVKDDSAKAPETAESADVTITNIDNEDK